MFHRITLEAGKLHDARLVKPSSPRALPRQQHSAIGGDDITHVDPRYYDKLSFKIQHKDTGNRIISFLRGNKLPLAFLLYIVVGTLFYRFDKANGVENSTTGILGFYQAITIGFSVGLSPKNPAYIPNPWFSSAYILVGAGLIALNLVVLGQKLEDKASNVVFEGLKRREDYEEKMSGENPFRMRLMAFINYNAPYLISIICWLLWLAFIIVWSIKATNVDDVDDPEKNWGFAYAQYFAISLCSSAGSFSLPSNSPIWGYGLAAVSMMIGVPLMALAVSCIVIMLSQGHRFNKVKRAAWDPVRLDEIDSIRQLGLCDGDGNQISKGGYVMLGLLRIGQDSGLIRYLADAYDAIEERGGLLTADNSIRSNDEISRHAIAFLKSDYTDTTTDDQANSKGTISQRDRRWSTTALKDEDSMRFGGGNLQSLKERLLSDDSSDGQS